MPSTPVPPTSAPQPTSPPFPPSPDQADVLVALPNPSPHRAYTVNCETAEFTCVCPVTGQPDFATVTITYTPAQHIVELKSLKLYLWSYHDRGVHHEAVTNQLLDHLVALLQPAQMTVRTLWNVRGGITTTVEASHPAAVAASEAQSEAAPEAQSEAAPEAQSEAAPEGQPQTQPQG